MGKKVPNKWSPQTERTLKNKLQIPDFDSHTVSSTLNGPDNGWQRLVDRDITCKKKFINLCYR